MLAMSGSLTVVPAYGRDYKSVKAALADWEADKDFHIAGGGPYINKADFVRSEDLTEIRIRFDKLQQVTIINK